MHFGSFNTEPPRIEARNKITLNFHTQLEEKIAVLKESVKCDANPPQVNQKRDTVLILGQIYKNYDAPQTRAT